MDKYIEVWTNTQTSRQIFTERLIELKYRWTETKKDVFRQVNREKDRRKYRQKDVHRESNGWKDRLVYGWIGRQISNGDLCNYKKTDRGTKAHIWTYGQYMEVWTDKQKDGH